MTSCAYVYIKRQYADIRVETDWTLGTSLTEENNGYNAHLGHICKSRTLPLSEQQQSNIF